MNLFTHSSESWKSDIRVPALLGSWALSSWLRIAAFSLHPHMADREQDKLSGVPYTSTGLIMRHHSHNVV